MVLSLLLILFIWLTPFRSKAYEPFLFTHQGLGIVCLVGMWWHTWEASFTSRLPVYVATGLLASLFVVDVGATLYHNRLFIRGPATARVTARKPRQDGTKQDRSLSVQVRVPPGYRFGLGQYVNLWIPGACLLAGLESHPFIPVPIAADEGDRSSTDLTAVPRDCEGYALVDLQVEPRAGLTRKLFRSALYHGPGVAYKANLRGPYGKKVSLDGFQHLLLVAWGRAQVAPSLQVLLKLSQRAQPGLRVVNLVWQVANAAEGEPL